MRFVTLHVLILDQREDGRRCATPRAHSEKKIFLNKSILMLSDSEAKTKCLVEAKCQLYN